MIRTLARLARLLPPESAHRITIIALNRGAGILPSPQHDDPRLAVRAFGLVFPNPIGLAAGFDKNAEVPAGVLKLGFGFTECGTVTPYPQPGNPRPRLFRLTEDRAIINRMGFNNEGMEAVKARLAAGIPGIVGINIGANKDSRDRIGDYVVAYRALAPFASYVAVNISSPNTPGLRGLQNRDELLRLLGSLNEERARNGTKRPLLLKIAPDLDDTARDDIAEVCLNSGIEGIIVSNTTVTRPPGLRSKYARESGGLSGAPLLAPSTAMLAGMRRRVGNRLVLVGVGGVTSAADAYAKIRAGARLVQLYSALVYEGPSLVARMKRELLDLMMRDGVSSIEDAAGADVV